MVGKHQSITTCLARVCKGPAWFLPSRSFNECTTWNAPGRHCRLRTAKPKCLAVGWAAQYHQSQRNHSVTAHPIKSIHGPKFCSQGASYLPLESFRKDGMANFPALGKLRERSRLCGTAWLDSSARIDRLGAQSRQGPVWNGQQEDLKNWTPKTSQNRHQRHLDGPFQTTNNYLDATSKSCVPREVTRLYRTRYLAYL